METSGLPSLAPASVMFCNYFLPRTCEALWVRLGTIRGFYFSLGRLELPSLLTQRREHESRSCDPLAFCSFKQHFSMSCEYYKIEFVEMSKRRCAMIDDTSIKNDGSISLGSNIRKIREAVGRKPGKLVQEVNLRGVDMTIFSLSKIEANTQHIRASQLKTVKESLDCSYEDLFKSISGEE